MKKFMITTPIYYASGTPHIGHAYTTILADIINRYKKLIGYETFFQTGTDEHGQKIEMLAKKAGMSEMDFVQQNYEKFIELFDLLGIKYDRFIRTTEANHISVVQKVFNQMLKNNDIYLGQWKGYYCVSCEENYTESQINKVDNKLYCSVGHEIVEKNEESYFFDMKKYANWLNEFLNNTSNFIIPNHRINELKNNFLNDLNNLSISRTSIKWGIPIIENNKHVIYVWLDALFNYLSGLGYLSDNDDNYQKFWNDPNTEKLHLMSKEITRFHCIYWPIFLKSLNLNLPTQIMAHGWIVTKEGKMSKSLGNVIDPVELISNYGRDSLRYFFAKETSYERDGVFSNEIFIDVINNDLANNIGNLVNRTIGMLYKYNNWVIPKYIGIINKNDKDIEKGINNLFENLTHYINDLAINEIADETIKLVKLANKYIEDMKPWELFKNNDINSLNSVLNHLCQVIRTIIVVLSPILIDGTSIMQKQMNFNDNLLSLDKCLDFTSLDEIQVNQATPIYQRF